MDRLIFNQTGGFPLTTDILNALQNAYNVFNAMSGLSGNLAILSGCEVRGNSVTDGVVAIGNEVFPFKGGIVSEKIIIREETESKLFEDGTTKGVIIKKIATFGNGTTTYNWADFKRINPLRELQKAVVPVGMIAMWSGQVNQIPQGWALCNGENGTPDLRNRFVMGYNDEQQAIKTTGGANSYNLTKAQLPAVKLTGTTDSAGSHSHNYGDIYHAEHNGYVHIPGGYGTAAHSDNNNKGHDIQRTTNFAGTHTHSFTTEDLGRGEAIDNRPAFMVLAYIMFIG